MAQLRTFLVVNPASANGATGRQFVAIAREVRAAIGGFEYAFTAGPMEASELATRALRAGFECVVAVGGDGTANEVVNGFFDEAGRPVREGAVLGVIPRGTGGDLWRTYQWPADLRSAAARLRGDATRRIDVGRVDFIDHRGNPVRRHFLNVASAGVSGQVDWEVNRTSKMLGGKASFMLGTARALWKHHDVRVRVGFDDQPAEQLDMTAIAVANGQYFGGGMWVAPGARPDDGLFDITIWSGFGFKDFVLLSRWLYDGRHVDHPKTRCLRARRVRIESDGLALLDVDGEQPGRLPASFEILPGALLLKVAEVG